jgi:hypothetical protein
VQVGCPKSAISGHGKKSGERLFAPLPLQGVAPRPLRASRPIPPFWECSVKGWVIDFHAIEASAASRAIQGAQTFGLMR